MRKNELIHLHALLRTLADRLVETGVVDDDALTAYRSVGVTPMSVQASRDDHEAAVLCLGSVLAAAVPDAQGGAGIPTTGDATTTSERPVR